MTVFLYVPKGFLRALAYKEITVGDEEEGEYDSDENMEEPAQQQQQDQASEAAASTGGAPSCAPSTEGG